MTTAIENMRDAVESMETTRRNMKRTVNGDEVDVCEHCGVYGLIAEFQGQKALACMAADVVELMYDDNDALLCAQCEIELESTCRLARLSKDEVWILARIKGMPASGRHG